MKISHVNDTIAAYLFIRLLKLNDDQSHTNQLDIK